MRCKHGTFIIVLVIGQHGGGNSSVSGLVDSWSRRNLLNPVGKGSGFLFGGRDICARRWLPEAIIKVNIWMAAAKVT